MKSEFLVKMQDTTVEAKTHCTLALHAVSFTRMRYRPQAVGL